MGTNRMVETNFWRDSYVEELDPSEKLLFLYLLSNPNTNIAGIYELTLRQMAFDTGFDKDMIIKILHRFEKDGKVYYSNGWIAMHNWLKHQIMNPKIMAGIQKIVDNLPEWLQKDILFDDQATLPLSDDSLSKPMYSLSKPIAFNLIKLNIIKYNSIPQNAEDLAKQQKRDYAKAVHEDEAQTQRAGEAINRKGSTKSISEIWGR